MTKQHLRRASGMVLLAGALFAGHVAAFGASTGPAARSNTASSRPYFIDRAGSRISVETRTSGLSSLFGHDHRFHADAVGGRLALDLDRPHRSRLELTVEADSLRLRDEVTAPVRQDIEGTVRGPKVLDVSRHPLISFRSNNVEAHRLDHETFKVTVRGELRLHGVTRSVVIPARVSTGPGRIRAVGALSLRQSDFAIEPPLLRRRGHRRRPADDHLRRGRRRPGASAASDRREVKGGAVPTGWPA